MIFKLNREKGLSYKEIADVVLNISQGTVLEKLLPWLKFMIWGLLHITRWEPWPMQLQYNLPCRHPHYSGRYVDGRTLALGGRRV